MLKKMERALEEGGNIFTMDDIEIGLAEGKMQSHVFGDTWIITQVLYLPRRKSVDILFVVGNLEESVGAEQVVENWARNIGADMMTAIGRAGWWKIRTPGWKVMGTLYSKEISYER